jgi:hypothetical protein
MSDYKIGDRVRYEFEGEIIDIPDYEDRVVVKSDGGVGVRVNPSRLTRVEPEYEKGAVYIDAEGLIFYRFLVPLAGAPWRDVKAGGVRFEHYPTRPLRKLVPEGE